MGWRHDTLSACIGSTPIRRASRVALLVGLLLTIPASAVELRSFGSPADEVRFRDLTAELRCLVCQNQSLSDSDAELAQDLRREVHEMLEGGKSDAEIIDFMVARYGDFVLYRPPLKASTVALWAGPFVLAVAGLGFLLMYLRRRNAAARRDDLGAGDTARLASLLDRRGGDA